MSTDFLLAFIPIFVAVDPIGVMPIFVYLTQGFDKKEKRRIIIASLTTGLCVACGFILLGKAVFRFLGITIADFMIAGGLILFCIAIMDVLGPGKQRRMPAEELGVVPLGTPLIVGPAVLTTSLMIVDQYGLRETLLSVLLNLILTGFILAGADILMRFLGQAGSRALSKIMALLLAAIAVMMIRKGILQLIP
jgi:multiple antibiotic resistance protein